MSKYTDILSKMQYHLQKKDEGYTMPLFPKYNKSVGNIIPGTFSVFAGSPASGRTSFVDTNYVMNPLLQWYNADERTPLKIIYFSMSDSELKKTQKLLCLYLMMVENIRMDLPTLNSQNGRLYDINERSDVLGAISNAQLFFDEIENEEVLDIVAGRRPPSEIYNYLLEFFEDRGIDIPDKEYEPHQQYEGGLVIVVIDSADMLLPEFDGYGKINKDDLNRKLLQYAEILTERYNVNLNIIIPSDPGFIRSKKDTIPLAKHLGIFGKLCDRGIVLYNPINEQTQPILVPGEPDSNYISNGINTLRFWFIVRNTEGADSLFDRYFILPGTGFNIEHSYLPTNEIEEFADVYKILMKTPSFYV